MTTKHTKSVAPSSRSTQVVGTNANNTQPKSLNFLHKYHNYSARIIYTPESSIDCSSSNTYSPNVWTFTSFIFWLPVWPIYRWTGVLQDVHHPLNCRWISRRNYDKWAMQIETYLRKSIFLRQNKLLEDVVTEHKINGYREVSRRTDEGDLIVHMVKVVHRR